MNASKVALPQLMVGCALTALMVLALIGLSGISAAAFSPVAQAAGSEAPPFNLTSIDGTNFSLSDYRGKVVVLDLIATWCPVCNDEMRELLKLRQEFTDVIIITISVDPTESDETLRSFKGRYHADWILARDTDDVLVKYQSYFVPTIVVIDPQGYISFQTTGFVPADELISEVTRVYPGGVEKPEKPEEPEEPTEASPSPSPSPAIEKPEETGETGKTVPTVISLYLLALVTGLFSFFAPCAFPLLPGYMSYYLGRYKGGTTLKSSVRAGIAAATGINGIFALLGAAVAAGGVAVKSYLSYLAPAVGFVIILLGLAMVSGKTEFFDKFGGLLSSYSSKIGVRSQHSGLFLYGVGYGLASMGCQAPVFIALVFAGLAAGGALKAFLVFLSFSIGMGCMMLTVSILAGTAKMQVLDRMRQLTPYINRVCGVILIVVGAYFLVEFI